MNQQSFGQRTGPDTGTSHAGFGSAPGGSGTSPAGNAAKGQAAGQKAASGKIDPNANQAVLGPFTVRDLAVFGGTLILFVASLLPLFGARYNLWNLNNLFFLGLGIILPVIVSALFAARRLAPATRLRVGSLSIDQFASVVASFTVAFFFLSVAGGYVASLLVGLIGSLVLFAATVLGRFIPYLSGDFKDRPEAPAHVVAREASTPARKPRAPKAPKPESGPGPSKAGGKAGGLFGGAGAGSSAVHSGTSAQPGSPAQPGSSAVQPGASGQPGGGNPGPSPEPVRSGQVPATAPPTAPATAAVPVTAAGGAAAASSTPPAEAGPAASAPAAGPAASTPVSTAPEASDRTPDVDAGPPTQAADVVRPAPTPEPEETQHGEVPAAHAPQAAWEPPAATAVHQQVQVEQPIGATVDPASRHDETDGQPIHEAFWFAVAQHRTAFDPRTGAPAFVIEPGGWVLALEDRGHEFLVQHTDGRLGVLRDLSNIERG
ncbi:hypothetical protein [Paenarthrobacter sp. 22069]|uniref:hypothetical protein n=1 Tax=Paenarthrobacter sp. 22069 TaxID=3453864 RepID=UPI003F852D52